VVRWLIVAESRLGSGRAPALAPGEPSREAEPPPDLRNHVESNRGPSPARRPSLR
jgi:hypothetical protein